MREDLFRQYSWVFLLNKSFLEINYRIFYFNESVEIKIINDLYSDDIDFLNNKKIEHIGLLKINNEYLNNLKYKYIRTLSDPHYLNLFEENFYTYSKIHETVIQKLEMRIYMYTFHYDRNTGTFPEIYINTPPTFDEYKSGKVKKTDKIVNTIISLPITETSNKFKELKLNQSLKAFTRRLYIFPCHIVKNHETFSNFIDQKIHVINQNETNTSQLILNKRLTPGKSFESIHIFFSKISKQYKSKYEWLNIKECDLANFINSLFDFGINESGIPSFNIEVTGAIWASMWHELKTKGYVNATNIELSDTLSFFFQNSRSNKISKSTFLTYLSTEERRNKIREDNNYISISTVKSFLE